MHPKEFIQIWQLTHAELGLLLGYSVDGINNWMRKDSPTQVPQVVLNCLQALHVQFEKWLLEDQLPLKGKEIFELAKTRRRGLSRNGTESYAKRRTS